MTTAIKPETAPYLDAFRNHEGNANEPNWLIDRRAAALKQFAALGFPTRRDEPWRFTNLTPLARAAFPPAPPPKVAEHRLQLEPYLIGGPAHRIVLIDGYFVPELSPIGRLPKVVWLGSTSHALAEREDLAEAGFDERDARCDVEDIAAGEEGRIERSKWALGVARRLGGNRIKQLRPFNNCRRSRSEPDAVRHIER